MSDRLPALTPRKIIRALERAGFYIHHTSGSHCSLRRPDKPHLRITIAYHRKDLPRSVFSSLQLFPHRNGATTTLFR